MSAICFLSRLFAVSLALVLLFSATIWSANAQTPAVPASIPTPAPVTNEQLEKQIQDLTNLVHSQMDQIKSYEDDVQSKAKASADAAQTKTDAAVKAANDAADKANGLATAAKGSTTEAQEHAAAAKKNAAVAAGLTKKAQASAAAADASAGVALNGTSNVQDNVEVQAVLLTRKPAERIFGREIARNYAIVQVTISNQSSTSALVVQSVSLDYTKWLMSGLADDGSGLPEDKEECPRLKPGLDKSFQRTCATRVASVEARVIRGELQDASTWTWRNGIVRGLVLVGSVASGYSFLGSADFAHAVTGFNGSLVPGVQTFWPDQTLPQVNRVSDFGFQTNKVVPKDNSDIVYAFFPIERFLTPGLRKIFLSAPALFFAPFEIFADKHIGSNRISCPINKNDCVRQSDIEEFKREIRGIAGVSESDGAAMQILMSHCLDTTPDSCEEESVALGGTTDFAKHKAQAQILKRLISGISLNNINVLVGGVMTVDVNTVPAVLKRVTFEKSDSEVFSKACGIQAGSIEGQFLSNGVPSISSIVLPAGIKKDSPFYNKKAEDFVDSITTVADQSNDLSIAFQLQLKNPVPPGSVLNFNVTKYDKGDGKKANPIKSADLAYSVTNYTPAPDLSSLSTSTCKAQGEASAKPAINDVTFAGTKAEDWAKSGAELAGTVVGSDLTDATPKVTKITLADKSMPAVDTYVPDGAISPVKDGSTATKLNFTLKPSKVVPAGTVLTFVVTTKDKDGKEQQSNTEKPYTTPTKPATSPTTPAQKKSGKTTTTPTAH